MSPNSSHSSALVKKVRERKADPRKNADSDPNLPNRDVVSEAPNSLEVRTEVLEK